MSNLKEAHWVKIEIPVRLLKIETKGELFERAITEWAKEEIHENKLLNKNFNNGN